MEKQNLLEQFLALYSQIIDDINEEKKKVVRK